MLEPVNEDTRPDLPVVEIDAYRLAVLAIAHDEIGKTDPSEYWQESFGSVPVKHYAWCGIFDLFCLRRAGLAHFLWSVAQKRPGFLFRLHTTKNPEPGDTAYFNTPYQHHAIVTRREGDSLWLVQGNYGTPGRVAESFCSIKQKKPTFYSIDCLLPADTAGEPVA